ncbi:regulatory protein RecX [Brachybacterium sp. MASK1Z-5]|uniref:Regulatory protein RecX n=1 Tax=Brachybacterium halotolerans TaxID=2795215 RepID=A0ABS1B7S4_9MICO|nr:regulatory protein RecX [Brachybacterium halotolerans]MBK0330547.1 regulatory protein RecX [Brachybacterium halotolerans]
MTPTHPTPAHRAPVQRDLAARTDEILARAPAEPTEAEREREKQVVSQCRYLMRLLSTRRRSAGEMSARLREREVPADVAHEVMQRIARADLIDDAAFARDWVTQRRELRGLADEALRRELEAKGVADADIDAALVAQAGTPQHAELEEEERCRELVRGRIAPESRRTDMGDRSERARMARRLEGYLRRRGYDGALIRRVVSSELLAATGR